MPHLKNKIIAFIFLLIIAGPVFLSLKFILEEHLIQQEADEKMESLVLRSVSIATAEIIWIRDKKEVLIDGRLFDVKSFNSKNELTTLTGFFDEKETKLLEEFKNFTENNSPDNPLTQVTIKFLFFPAYHCRAAVTYEISWHLISNQYHSFDESLPAPPSLALTRPPQL